LPAQSPDLNITEPLWSVLETRERNRFPPPKSPKQPEDVLQEKWYTIPLETVQNLYESTPRRNAVVLKTKGGPTPYSIILCNPSISLLRLTFSILCSDILSTGFTNTI
jgi:hypothetical protein